MFIYIHVYLTTYFICRKYGECVKVKVQLTLIRLHVIITLTGIDIQSELQRVIDCGEGGRVYSRLQPVDRNFQRRFPRLAFITAGGLGYLVQNPAS